MRFLNSFQDFSPPALHWFLFLRASAVHVTLYVSFCDGLCVWRLGEGRQSHNSCESRIYRARPFRVPPFVVKLPRISKKESPNLLSSPLRHNLWSAQFIIRIKIKFIWKFNFTLNIGACSKVFLASELNFLSSTVCSGAKLKQTKSRERDFWNVRGISLLAREGNEKRLRFLGQVHVSSDERGRDIRSYRIHVRDSCKCVCVSVSQEPFIKVLRCLRVKKLAWTWK